MTTYRSIWISDVHLGTSECRAEELNSFLKHNTCKTLYLVGDIFDGLQVTKNRWYWDNYQSAVVRAILRAATHTRVIFVPGNHDAFVRPVLKHEIGLMGIEVHNQLNHVGVDGKQYLVTHGDLFQGMSRVAPWLAHLGDTMYDVVVWLNKHVNTVRRRCGWGYWSMSKYVKLNINKAVEYIRHFEESLSDHAARKGYDGVICGHIHHADIKTMNGVQYMNDGDWVESCTALVEHHDGRFEIVTWDDVRGHCPDDDQDWA